MPAPYRPSTLLELADIVDQAADLIDTVGLHQGGLWPTRTGTRLDPYRPGQPCCVAGALGVALGVTDPAAIEADLLGLDLVYDHLAGKQVRLGEHPVMHVLIAELDLHSCEDLFVWSDSSTHLEVVTELRSAADRIRANVGGVTA